MQMSKQLSEDVPAEHVRTDARTNARDVCQMNASDFMSERMSEQMSEHMPDEHFRTKIRIDVR